LASNGGHLISSELLNQIRDDDSKFKSVKNYQDLPLEDIEKILEVNGDAIKHITNPSFHLRKIAILQNPMSIKYIKDLTDEEIKQSIKAEPLVIRHVKEPNKEIALLAVSLFTNAILCIDKPSEEVKLLAIIKSDNHQKLINGGDLELLASTYRFLCKNKIGLCTAFAKSSDFTNIEEMIVIKEKIRRQIIHKHPELETYI
jgi:hypothetical protein